MFLYGFQPGHPNQMMPQPYMPYPPPYPMMYAPALDAYGNIISPTQQAPLYYNSPPTETHSKVQDQSADERSET